MESYTIRLELNPKPIPDRRHDYDCWIDGDEEFGSSHGATAWEALHCLAERLEMEADRQEPECPACNCDYCVCDYLHSDRGIRQIIDLDLKTGRDWMGFRSLRDEVANRALEILSCESLLAGK